MGKSTVNSLQDLQLNEREFQTDSSVLSNIQLYYQSACFIIS